MNALTPNYNGPRFGVEARENNRFCGVLYDASGVVIASDKRLPYGEAFEEAYKLSKKHGKSIMA